LTFEEFIRRVEEAAVAARLPFGFGSRFRPLQDEVDPAEFEAMTIAVDYMLAESEEQRERWGRFAPMLELGGQVYPPPLDEVRPELVEVWTRAYEIAQHPIIRARLAELLWTRRDTSNRYRYGLGAIDALVASSELDIDDLYRAEYLGRALQLARALSDDPRTTRIVERLVQLARRHLSEARNAPAAGAARRLLEPLSNLPENQRPPDLRQLVEEMAEAYQGNVWAYGPLLRLTESLVNGRPEELEAIRRRVVTHQIAHARSVDGLVRIAELREALEAAQAFDLSDLIEQIRVALQNERLGERRLAPFSAEASLDSSHVGALINGIVGSDSWEDALRRFGAWGPFTRDREELVASIEREMHNSIRFLVTQVILDEDDNIIRRTATPENHKAIEISRSQQVAILFHAQFAAEILKQIHKVYGALTTEQLAAFFERGYIRPGIAFAIARGLKHYWNGDYDSAAMVVVTRLESVLRELGRQLGFVIFIEERGGRPGQYVGLGRLLDDFIKYLPADFWLQAWMHYFRAALVDSVALNLRDKASHGLIEEFDAVLASVVLHIACFLRLLERPEPSDS